MTKTKNPTGLELAVQLTEEHETDWLETTPEELAVARFAVVVRNYSQSWVLAAADWQEVANIELGNLTTDSDDTEYVESIYEMATGEIVRYESHKISVEFVADGKTYKASTP